MMAGWAKGDVKRGKLFLYAPPPQNLSATETVVEQTRFELVAN